MSRRRVDLNSSLRRLRALRVALGERRFRWRPLDRRGRWPLGFPRVCRSEEDCLRLMHTWLNDHHPSLEKWWFSVEEIALDCNGDYGVVVKHSDILVFRDDLWGNPIGNYRFADRKAVPCG